MRHALSLALLSAALACTSSAPGPARDADDYLRFVAVRMPVGSESILLRWPEKQMPLKVHLPRPPDGLFEEPEGIFDSVRDGVLDWTDVAAPGVPSFVFVDHKGDADIPIVWAAEPDGAWYIAFCAYEGHALTNRFDVSRILALYARPIGTRILGAKRN